MNAHSARCRTYEGFGQTEVRGFTKGFLQENRRIGGTLDVEN